MKKLWGGRFAKELAPVARHYSYSLAVDGELLPCDIAVNHAHVKTLAKARMITKTEAARLIRGLAAVEKELTAADLAHYVITVEDVHTLVQNCLEKKIGPLAKKLHTARSRNDQVTTGTRLYVKTALASIGEELCAYQRALVAFAERAGNVAIPGYTHLQRAQLVLMAHHVLAYVEMAGRDQKRLAQAYDSADELPLGSGALAGLAFKLDRAYTAKLLGFSRVSANSMDAVSDRDYVIDALSAVAVLFMHLSRFAEDMLLWSSQEFSFIDIPEEFATGSSIMPHKKNADMLELTRGRAGKAYSNLLSVLVMMKGLPLAYNRDMQEDKEALFSSLTLAYDALQVLTGMIGGICVRESNCMIASYDSFLYATDLMDAVVKRGVALHDAHRMVGAVVRYALDNRKDLGALTTQELGRFVPGMSIDMRTIVNPEASLARRMTTGSTNPRMVRSQIARWKNILKKK